MYKIASAGSVFDLPDQLCRGMIDQPSDHCRILTGSRPVAHAAAAAYKAIWELK
ncbi:MAG: hypothetical protein IKG34_14580 [Solobacterium sp.]|nr:hypothetical protein [Solobacterium sp.]